MKTAERHLHIISFDVPYPANYGGVIDVFYKIKALHQLGIKVHLHAFHYGRNESEELSQLCHEVHYYKRRTYKNPFIGKTPYIVSTRNDDTLLRNLLYDDYPILFEGLHTTYHLADKLLKDRIKIVRMHNIEHQYYAKLEESERSFFKKYFFKVESQNLRSYEKILHHAQLIAAISPADFAYLNKKFKGVFYLPAFHSNEQVQISTEDEPFVLYHGNLGVGENDVAARFLLREVFNDLDVPLVIAGNNPSDELIKLVEERSNVTIQPSLTTAQIDALISKAHINLLPTFQATGIKLKLINALYKGKFCLVNSLMVKNTGLESLCIVKDKPEQIRAEVKKLMSMTFDNNLLAQRQQVLEERFCNVENARMLNEQIFRLKT